MKNSTWFLLNIYDKQSCSAWPEEYSIKIFFDTIPCFWVMTSFVTSFYYNSLIYYPYYFFDQLNLIFTECFSWFRLKCSTWKNEHFGKILLWYYISVLTYDVILDVILLYLTNFTTQSPFWATQPIFTKYLWWVKLFNVTRGTF